jgi:hypothetical protein
LAPGVRQPGVPGRDATRARAAEKKSGELILEADELWSFVGGKRDVWWVWVALDARTRQVVAMACGGRDERTAQCLWDALPDAYRDGAVVATDFRPRTGPSSRRSGTRRPGRTRA